MQDSSTELFLQNDIDVRPFTTYVSWFIDSDNSSYNIIQLPPIQRNAVWNTNQIERLWDSILRGFPIGSFLLCPRNIGSNARSIYADEQKKSKKNGYFLLDGQQRTRAILLGFKSNTNSRLWIDLNPKLLFDNVDYNDRKFLLRHITTYQPWGMSDKNPLEKISENEKYKARTELYKNSIRYDYQVQISLENKENKDAKYSWPIKAAMPIPFDSLVDLCGGTSGSFSKPEWSEVLKLIPDKFKKDTPPDHYYQIIDALQILLDTSPSNKNQRAVAFLKQKEIADTDGESQEPIEVLFKRINSGGTILAGEEMAYSLLKANWDQAYDLVSKILNDEEIGYLLPATGIIMAATRVARHNLKKTDDASPSVSNFRKWIGEQPIYGASFLEEMQNLMKLDGTKSKFHSIVSRFCKLALYRETNSLRDIGIPRRLLLSVKPVMLHPILIWLHDTDEGEDEANRESILRYLIYSLLGVKEHNKASKTAIESFNLDKSGFPDKVIYSLWTENELACQMPDIEEFKHPLNNATDGFLKTWDELMGPIDDPYRAFRSEFWNKKEMLLWFQRAYHTKWFQGYNPMSNDAYDTPYDYDHILPYSHLISAGFKDIYSENEEMTVKFFNSRYLYINSIGNYRLWPTWANRSDGNVCHTIKMHMDDDRKIESDSIATELLLNSFTDYLSASHIDVKDAELWQKAGGNPRDWNAQRRVSWQKAVENRVLYLFCDFFTSFTFTKWIDK